MAAMNLSDSAAAASLSAILHVPPSSSHKSLTAWVADLKKPLRSFTAASATSFVLRPSSTCTRLDRFSANFKAAASTVTCAALCDEQQRGFAQRQELSADGRHNLRAHTHLWLHRQDEVAWKRVSHDCCTMTILNKGYAGVLIMHMLLDAAGTASRVPTKSISK